MVNIFQLYSNHNHIDKFKTYYAEQAFKNNSILTDDRRRDVLVIWIINDRQYNFVNKKIKGQPHEKIINKADSGQPNAFNSGLLSEYPGS